jgi:hypothetical protein
MGPLSLSEAARPPQGLPWRRLRRCLLKGCERWYRPTRPQCRYCSAGCRQAAARWRRWQAQQRYRTTRNGRSHRQQQARRYRQRCQTRLPPGGSGVAGVAPRVAGSVEPCEGKRLLEKSEKVPLGPCDRPGCYVLFAAGGPYQPRRFCCALCRRALRCVLDREARWRRRRRRGLRRPGRRPRRRARGP